MRDGRGARKVMGFLMPMAALMLAAAFLLVTRGRFRRYFPVLNPQDGVIDVRDVDFDSDVYHLANKWDYYPGHLYTPQDLADPEIAATKSDAPLDPVMGSWRLRIIAQPETMLSLCSFSIDYSTTVFVNGREVRRIGNVSADPAEFVPKVRYMTLPLYTGADGKVEIVYQYSNHMHNDGGFIQSTVISTPENIDEYQRGITVYSLILSGGLIFLMFYFMLCASFQKNREYAALALCCLVIAFRNQFFFAEHLLSPDYNYVLEYRTVVLDVSLIPATAFGLLAAFFPQSVDKKIMLAFTGVFAVLIALHFILIPRSLVALCHVSYYVCIPFTLWAFWRLGRHFIRERRPDMEDALTLGAILFFTVMLIRDGILTGSDATVNHFGLTPLTMVICILLLAVVISDRIQKQQRLLTEMQQRNDLLTRVNDMNRDFLRTVAHELKTPLTVISGYAQLIRRQIERNKLSEKTPERLDAIQSEADRLAEMVGKLMEYTYGRSQQTEMTGVDLDSLFRSAEAVLAPVCARRQNTLSLLNGCTGAVHGNEELLLQVLINLIVNASRHTEEGAIRVEAADEGAFAAITVTDTGTGIAPEAVPHIFEKGFTTDEGRGLGLAICLETVSLHGGALELVSTGPEGTVFRFTVPKEE